jgi:hypothetical protein
VAEELQYQVRFVEVLEMMLRRGWRFDDGFAIGANPTRTRATTSWSWCSFPSGVPARTAIGRPPNGRVAAHGAIPARAVLAVMRDAIGTAKELPAYALPVFANSTVLAAIPLPARVECGGEAAPLRFTSLDRNLHTRPKAGWIRRLP